MTEEFITLLLPFESLVSAISTLNMKEKRQLWNLLNEQIDQAEKIQETQTTYETVGYSTEEGTLHTEILEELKKLPFTERLTIIEAALQLIRQELEQIDQLPIQSTNKQELATAAKALTPDYTKKDDLTAFTALDSEDFYEPG